MTRNTLGLKLLGRSGAGSRCRKVERRRSSPPVVEFLERRELLSVDVVTNSNNNGAGSLRATIAAAAPGDTIVFDMSPVT